VIPSYEGRLRRSPLIARGLPNSVPFEEAVAC